MNKPPFSNMTPESRRFYARIFNRAILNIHAVRKGYFDVLICDSNEDDIMARWEEAVPQIMEMIILDNKAK